MDITSLAVVKVGEAEAASLETLLTYAPLLNIVIVAIIVPLFKLLYTIRANDIRHINEQFTQLNHRLDSVDAKLDAHFQLHMEKDF